MQTSLSLIITAYNEAPIIKDCVQTCIDSLAAQFTDYEIILINDASVDNTGQIMDKLALEHQRIICLHNSTNQNMGASVQRGMSVATKDYVTFNAADLPFDPSKYKDIINQAPDADMIVVERIKYKGTTLNRRILSKLNRAIMHILFPRLMRGLHDTNYFQITRKSALPNIMPQAQGPIFTWPEMVFRARHSGMNVVPIEAEYKPKHERKGAFGKPHDILWGLREMLHFRCLLWCGI
ncbi:MAG: glycosyltransferase [Oscillospiraceae bacterium]|nr:glycosyltransferase [Oscillospiraceae bacterium]